MSTHNVCLCCTIRKITKKKKGKKKGEKRGKKCFIWSYGVCFHKLDSIIWILSWDQHVHRFAFHYFQFCKTKYECPKISKTLCHTFIIKIFVFYALFHKIFDGFANSVHPDKVYMCFQSIWCFMVILTDFVKVCLHIIILDISSPT